MVDGTLGDAGREEMVDLIHQYVYADKPREKAAQSIINGSMRLNPDVAMNVGSIEKQLNWFKSVKLVSGTIGLDQLIDTSYVKTL